MSDLDRVLERLSSVERKIDELKKLLAAADARDRAARPFAFRAGRVVPRDADHVCRGTETVPGFCGVCGGVL